jgi:amino acid transporter
MESASFGTRGDPLSAAAHDPEGAAPGEKGLKTGALGYLSNLVIGTASVAPAYSLAATLGFVVAVSGMGAHAPAVMIVSFIPMVLIAAGYYWLNRADPDCGTTFTWVTRAMGPRLGWLNGWVIVVADIVVMATLAQIAGIYTFRLVGADSWVGDGGTWQVIVAAVAWIALMTWICWRGIELSARIQFFLLSAEIIILGIFCVVALGHVYIGKQGTPIEPYWFSPFNLPGGFTALIDGVLLGVFIYWGWDSGVCVNEESRDSSSGPGRAAVMSTFLLLLVYVTVSASAQSFAGTHFLINNQNDVLSSLGGAVFGSPLDKLLILAVLTSASASTQTTILPTARTTLSMARFGAIPKAFGRIHPRFLTPDVSTLVMGAISIIWTILILIASQNVLGDSISGLGFLIAFYYGFTGFACVIFYRRELTKSAKNFFMAGVVPLVGALMLTGIFVKAAHDYNLTVNTYSGKFLGVGVPDAIGIGLILLGIVVMVVANIAYPTFFKRKREVAEPGILEGEVVGEASVMAD